MVWESAVVWPCFLFSGFKLKNYPSPGFKSGCLRDKSIQAAMETVK
ncbi:hypothetical protein NEICINOT_03878 [Neisseria cinerea ATCC 14685]|uniref:Uncharacterized protein n=1 Tax=Neisseria cinerea ATCC 14685 TaxID=546262 RepID=D0W2J5_NEICI|nr:hypothetical protein NEICINOT_03878 [Neisseria cinerea ATCC 14685]